MNERGEALPQDELAAETGPIVLGAGAEDAARVRWQADPFHRYLGVSLDEQRDGRSRLSLRMTAATPRGVAGSLNGGVTATLIDLACIAAVASLIDRETEEMAGTAELNVSYLRPAFGPVIVAEGVVLKKGRTLAAVDVSISDGAGRLYAKGRCQYALRQRR
jgi:acyl-CoA thioesterase